MLIFPPTFGMYAFDAAINAAEVIEVSRRPDFSLDMEAIMATVGDRRPKMAFLASPNNPDGSLVPPSFLERLLDLPIIVVLDEAYIEFAPPGSSQLEQVLNRGNLAVLRTFSKWAGLAGLRVGYGAFPSSLIPHLRKVKQPYTVSVAASTAACVSLECVDELKAVGKRLVAERERLFAALLAIPYLDPYPSHANFILCRVEGRDGGKLKADLARSGILLRHFNTPALRDHIRISVGKPEHSDKLLAALAELE